MDWYALVAYARATSWTDISNYNLPDVLTDLNAAYHTIEDAIVKKIWEKFFWNRATWDSVPYQSEYTFMNQTFWNIKGTNKIYGVSIDYGNTWTFTKCFRQDTDLLDHDESYYEVHQPKTSPFYEVKDNSVFVYPAPVDNTSKIRVFISTGLVDFDETVSESDLFNGKIPAKYHYIIGLWARQYSYIRQKLLNEAMDAENKFQRELATMISSLNTRVASASPRWTAPWFYVNPL